MSNSKHEATYGVERDEGTDPDPSTIVPLEEYEQTHPDNPSAEELAADRNLFGAGEPPLSDDAPEESGGDAADPDGEV